MFPAGSTGNQIFYHLLTVLLVSTAMVFLLLAVKFKSLTLPLLNFLAQPGIAKLRKTCSTAR